MDEWCSVLAVAIEATAIMAVVEGAAAATTTVVAAKVLLQCHKDLDLRF